MHDPRDQLQAQILQRLGRFDQSILEQAWGDPRRSPQLDLCAILQSWRALTASEAEQIRQQAARAHGAGQEQGAFGHYQIVEEMARGGMGVVYKALDPHLNRLVAIKKILKDSDQSSERFRREAQLLAKLNHPHIARIHKIQWQGPEAPYLVMDYVDGQALSERIAEEEALDDEEAARILGQLCQALSHAHAQGILHRDLKPANVIMDSEDRAILIDFGIAEDVNNAVPLTKTGQMVGTLCYMPPEQIAKQHGAVTERSDVYGLGAVFYEMLTGRVPFEGDGMELVGAVINAEPDRPRAVSPLEIRKDFETICLKCLEKEPERRYGSAQDLLEDLKRALDGEPILAQPIPSAVRFLRRAQRQKAKSLAVLLFLALVLALAIFIPRILKQSSQIQYSEDERRALDESLKVLNRLNEVVQYRYRPIQKAAAERRLIDSAKAEAEALISELESITRRHKKLAPAYVLKGRAELLLYRWRAALESCNQALSCDPESGPAWSLKNQVLTRQLVLTLADARLTKDQKHGRGEAALECLKKAEEFGEQPHDLTKAWQLILKGRYPQAEAALRKLADKKPSEELALAQALLASVNGQSAATIKDYFAQALQLCPRMFEALHLRASLLFELKEHQEALADLNKAVQISDEHWRIFNLRANVYAELKDFDKALDDADRALKLAPKDPHPWITRANQRRSRGDLPGAVEDLEQALKLDPKNWRALVNRGIIHRDRSDTDKALKDFNAALENGGEPSNILIERGDLFKALGRYQEALEDYDRVLRRAPESIVAWTHKGNLLMDQGKLQAALEVYNRCLQIRAHPTPLSSRGWCYFLLRKLDDAQADCDKALSLDPKHAESYLNRASLVAYRGQYQVAMADFRKAIQYKPTLASAYIGLGNCYARLGQYKEATREYNRALKVQPRSGQAYVYRGVAWEKQGQVERALENYNKAIEVEPKYARSHAYRALILASQGKAQESFEGFQKALQLNPRLAEAHVGLSAYYGERKQIAKAIHHCDQALLADPKNVGAALNRGVMKYNSGRKREALADFRRVLQLAPKHPQAAKLRQVLRNNGG